MFSSPDKWILATALLWTSYFYPLKAQRVIKSTPLHAFFQADYDSTIIYQSSSSSNESPNYLIIAKHKERVYFFTYVSPYRGTPGGYYPGNLIAKFSREEQRFRHTTPDTNRYFLPKPISPSTLLHSWRQLQPHQFWTIKDDQASRQANDNCVVEHGGEHTFYLIDKKGVKVLSFYAPDFFEACRGKDLGRQRAIQVITMLRSIQQNANAR